MLNQIIYYLVHDVIMVLHLGPTNAHLTLFIDLSVKSLLTPHLTREGANRGGCQNWWG